MIFPSVACSPHELSRTGPPTVNVLTLLALSQKCTMAAQHRADVRATAEDDGIEMCKKKARQDAFEAEALAVLASLRNGQPR